MRIMVVDDESTICNGVARFLLRRWPALNVIKFNNAADALEAMRRERPHLLITDIRMPEMSGLELIERARELGVTRYAVLTGYDEFRFAQQAVRLRAQDYLLKPVDKERLYALVEQVMREMEADTRTQQAALVTGLRLMIQYDVSQGDLPDPISAEKVFGEGVASCAVVLAHAQDAVSVLEREAGCAVRRLGMDQNHYFIGLALLRDGQEQGFEEAAARLLRARELVGWHVVPAELTALSGAYQAVLDETASGLQRAASAYQHGERAELPALLVELLGGRSLSERFETVTRFCGMIHIRQEAWRLLTMLRELDALAPGARRERVARWLDELAASPVPVTRGVIAAMDIIAQQYAEELSLAQVAQRVYMAPSYFSTLFHRETGVTFVEYVNRARVDRSCALMLERDDRSIDEIARQVGYPNTHYFFKVFRRITGATPGAFRQLLRP